MKYDNGFVYLWRKLLETSFYKDSYADHLAIHLLLNANYKELRTVFNGQEIESSEDSLVEDLRFLPGNRSGFSQQRNFTKTMCWAKRPWILYPQSPPTEPGDSF